MATIELGELSAKPSVEIQDDPTPGRLPPRGVRVAALLVLLLATVTSAVPTPRSLPEVVVSARLGVDAFTAGDQLIVADPVSNRGVEQWLTAYRLSDGEQLWRVPMPLPGNAGPRAVIGATLVMSAEWGAVIPSETVALDLATGSRRWRRLAWLDGVTASGEVLLWTSRFGDWTRGEERPGTLRAVSAETGGERWSVPLPAGAIRTYRRDHGWSAWRGEARMRQVVTVLPSGELQTRDIGTGKVLRSMRIPAPEAGRRHVEVIGDMVLLNDDGQDFVTAYALDSLARRWRLRAEPGEYGPLPCAELLCLYGPSGGVRALDPETGRVLWTGRRWGTLLPADDRMIAVDGGEAGVLARPLAVIDPATGAVLSWLGAWNVLGPSPDGGLLAVRPGPQDRTWVARLDATTGRFRLLDRLREVSGDCHIGSGVLHCRRMNGSIGIWRLPG